MKISTSSYFGSTERGPAHRRTHRRSAHGARRRHGSAITSHRLLPAAAPFAPLLPGLPIIEAFSDSFSHPTPRQRGSVLFFPLSTQIFLNESVESSVTTFLDNWDMITSPSASALKNSDICVAWESSSSRNRGSANVNKPFLHSAPPSDPLRQANRLPIKVLKMLTARSGHILHPEYLQPLPSTPVSPIEVSVD